MEDDAKQSKKALYILASLSIAFAIFFYSYFFWKNVCSSGWTGCLGQDHVFAPIFFLVVSLFRPFLLTPLAVTALIGGQSFGIVMGTLLIAVGSVLSTLVVYFPSKYLATKFLKPWLSANLPETWRLLRTQDYKVVFAARWIPFLPFDLLSVFFGALGFRLKSVIIASFFGILPEAYVYSLLSNMTKSEFSDLSSLSIVTAGSLSLLAVLTLLPVFMYEFVHRKSSSSLIYRLRKVAEELKDEVNANNQLEDSLFSYVEGDKPPVLLLYGFFSSRKGSQKMAKILTNRGFSVMSFNLGGLMGVYNTRNIVEIAYFIDEKIREQQDLHGFKKINIVAHSKGGLVAIWWLLKLGGFKSCDKLITMGTPFSGTWTTYLAIFSPLGIFWRDVWQMRPGSTFLKKLLNSKIPENLSIHCLYSNKDRVSNSRRAIFQPLEKTTNIVEVPVHSISHFEFQESEEVAEIITQILIA